jgi:hypothetical protein
MFMTFLGGEGVVCAATSADFLRVSIPFGMENVSGQELPMEREPLLPSVTTCPGSSESLATRWEI